MEKIDHQDWLDTAVMLFGGDPDEWRYICPRCGTEQGVKDFLAAGKDLEFARESVGFSCIGRVVDGKGCDWTLGGLLHLHELEVVTKDGGGHPMFRFAAEHLEGKIHG